MEPQFRASGLASGIDSTALVEKLMQIEARPLNLLSQRQAAYGIQLSTIATLISGMKALGSAAETLKTSGVTVNSSTGSFSDFTVSGTAATEGRYEIRVNRLAQEAKARTSVGYSSTTDEALVPDGTLQFKLDAGSASELTYTFDTTGKSLGTIVSDINANAPKLVASIIHDGTDYFLTVSRRETGHAGADVDAANGLVISQQPGVGFMNVTQQAANARVYVDDLAVYRKTNSFSDVISGVTFTLKAASDTDVTLSYARDNSASAANVQKLLDAYNSVAGTIRKELRSDPKRNPDERLKGTFLQTMQRVLQDKLSAVVHTTGTVRTLADIGVELQKDGTLILDRTTFDAAAARDPDAVNALFQKASTGVADTYKAISDNYTKTNGNNTGLLLSQQAAVENAVKVLTERTEKVQKHIEATRERLLAQFAAMERVYQNFLSIGSFLENQTWGMGNDKK